MVCGFPRNYTFNSWPLRSETYHCYNPRNATLQPTRLLPTQQGYAGTVKQRSLTSSPSADIYSVRKPINVLAPPKCHSQSVLKLYTVAWVSL